LPSKLFLAGIRRSAVTFRFNLKDRIIGIKISERKMWILLSSDPRPQVAEIIKCSNVCPSFLDKDAQFTINWGSEAIDFFCPFFCLVWTVLCRDWCMDYEQV